MTSQHVHSSHVDHVHHDPETNDLTVRWKDGKTSVYSGVPASLARTVANSPSVGQALHGMVKGKFGHRYA